MPPSHVALRLLIEGGEPATREVDGSAEAVQNGLCKRWADRANGWRHRGVGKGGQSRITLRPGAPSKSVSCVAVVGARFVVHDGDESSRPGHESPTAGVLLREEYVWRPCRDSDWFASRLAVITGASYGIGVFDCASVVARVVD